MITIDIVCVCLNDRPGLSATLRSIAAQSYESLKVIVVDGGSTDGSVELLGKQTAIKNLDWSTGSDGGIYDAMNKGLERSSGDFVMFLNAGDTLFCSDSIANLASEIGDLDCLYFSRCRVLTGAKEQEIYPSCTPEVAGLWCQKNLPAHSAMLFPRCFTEVNRYDLFLKIASDNDFKFRALAQLDVRFLDVVCSNFCVGGISTKFSLRNLKTRYRERLVNELKYTKGGVGITVMRVSLIFIVKLVFRLR